MRQHKNLQRFPREDASSVIHYEWEALVARRTDDLLPKLDVKPGRARARLILTRTRKEESYDVSACPGEVGSGSPIKDMRQRKNLQRFPREDAWSVIRYEWEAL